MSQDYTPTCDFCNKKLRKKERNHYKKTKEKLCHNCFKWFKKTMNNAGLKVNMEEEYQ